VSNVPALHSILLSNKYYTTIYTNIILDFHTLIYDTGISFQIVFEGILAYNHVYNEIAIDDIRLSQGLCGNFLLFGSFGFL